MNPQRAYGGDVWSIVAGHPYTMNGCDGWQLRVRWRLLSEPLLPAVTTYPTAVDQQTFASPESPAENVDSNGWVDVEAAKPASEGEMILGGCEQPVIRSTVSNLLVDYTVEVTIYEPAV